MTAKKTATLNLRIDPAIKEAAQHAAEHEHRSVANWIEVLIRQRCQTLGIRIPEQQTLFGGDDHGPQGTESAH